MARAAAAGLTPDQMLAHTPRELHAVIKGAEQRFRDDAKIAIFAAWQTAALMRTSPKKRLPNLQGLLRKLDENPDMSPEQLRAALLNWHKEIGGAVRVVPKGSIRRQ